VEIINRFSLGLQAHACTVDLGYKGSIDVCRLFCDNEPALPVPKRVSDRIRSSFKKYVEVLIAQRDRDVSEADTVTIVKDILHEVFGYDKYSELTSELAIRGTYCDLAIKLDGKARLLLEVKAIGLTLTERHTKQAVDYAANQGIEWVILTNGIHWILYQVLFKKPIEQHIVVELDLLSMNPRTECDMEKLYLLTREGIVKGAIKDYQERKDATSRYVLSAILLNSEAVLSGIRREVRRLTDVMVDSDVIAQVLRDEVIKREALEGSRAEEAHRRAVRRGERSLRAECPDALESPRSQLVDGQDRVVV
jgi:hypothetical protein